jgi:hypothetical protein
MKKILPVAVLAALAGVNAAQAVHVNPDGTGQVLVFPFYTVEGGRDTYINLANTTDEYKAVKVRILESMNSVEVLDFNLYLSPHDHWSAVITAHADGGASIKSNDNSCTVPLAISNHQEIPFRKFEYVNDSVNGIERTREGYVEVIEMGVVVEGTPAADAILHDAAGQPDDCQLLDTYWANGGTWDTNSSTYMTYLSGGLYGYGVLIDVSAGTDASYDAVAVDNWINDNLIDVHTAPGSLFPSITSQADDEYAVFVEGGVVEGQAFSGADAMTAVLMQATIANDYVLDEGIGAGTDWVVTFPTKREYVNGIGAPITPFTRAWNPLTSSACEQFGIEYWNREEGTPIDPVDPNDFSPLPPAGEIPTFSFCHEANVLTFNESNVLDASSRTGVNLNLEDGFQNGWARIDFEGIDRELPTLDHVFYGLPAVGFAVQRYIDENLTDGVMGSYAGTDLHKGHRDVITSSAP